MRLLGCDIRQIERYSRESAGGVSRPRAHRLEESDPVALVTASFADLPSSKAAVYGIPREQGCPSILE